MISKLNHISN
jgi:hypothetical protein